MQDIATETGFQVVAAVAAIAEHSICREYATGRPDDADARELASLGVAIFEKIKRNTHFKSLTLPGNRPYKQSCTGPFPTANERCTNCGTCARLCPTDAISIDTPQKNNTALCIGCMRCVSVCPTGARSIGERLAQLSTHLQPLCCERKNNEIFM